VTAPTLSLTESQTLTALGNFLVAIMPAGTTVVVGQDNRVPAPTADNYIVMTPILKTRLATNLTAFTDGYPSNPQTRADMQPTQVTVQIDIHGPLAADNAQVFTTLFRSSYGCDQFATSGFDVTPLYTSEPRQIPFVNEGRQVEKRYTVDANLHCNPVVTTAQDFADHLTVGVINVDATYAP
jgi:hypothetical protein